MKKFIWSHVSTCLPDYWQGCDTPYVQIAIPHKGMTFKALREAIRKEIRTGLVQGSGQDAMLLAADYIADAKQERIAIILTRAAYAAVNRMTFGGKRRLFQDITYTHDDCGTVYAYFKLTEI